MTLENLKNEIKNHFEENEVKFICEKTFDNGTCFVTCKFVDHSYFNVIWLASVNRFSIVNCQNKCDYDFYSFDDVLNKLDKIALLAGRCVCHIAG